MGQEGRVLGPRIEEPLQLLLLPRRGSDRSRQKVLLPRDGLHHRMRRRGGPAQQPRGAPQQAPIPPADGRRREGGVQLLHVQRAQHRLQEMRAHIEALPRPLRGMRLDGTRLRDAHHRLSQAGEQLQRAAPDRGVEALLRETGREGRGRGIRRC